MPFGPGPVLLGVDEGTSCARLQVQTVDLLWTLRSEHACFADVARPYQPDASQRDAWLLSEAGDDVLEDLRGRQGLGHVQGGPLQGLGVHPFKGNEIS